MLHPFPPSPAPRATARRRASPIPMPVLAAFGLAALIVLSGLSAALPSRTLAATTLAARCSGVQLRTLATTRSASRTTLRAGAKVVAVATVRGGSWSTYCAGTSKRGSTWYRISSVNGRSVRSLYGVSYLYAATSLFKSVVTYTTLYSTCSGTTLRATASTTATIKARLAAGTRVVTTGPVTGSSWRTACGPTVSGSAWYRIVSVNGKSVSSLYGVSAVYGARSLFGPTAVAPSPTPSPTATPPAAATATPVPTPTPTPIPIGTPIPSQAPACFPPSPAPTSTPSPSPSSGTSPAPSPTASPSPTATPAPTPTPAWSCVEGIDVSNWQGTINWQQVAAAGKKFAFVKASEGTTYVDPWYAANRTNANANGIVVGAYHFAQPSTAAGDAKAEADLFVNVAAPRSGDLVPVLDLEITNGLTVSQLQTWVRAWLGEVYARTGAHAAIYVSPSFWSTSMGNTTWFAQNGFPVLWIAHWTTASSPTVPASGWGGQDWTFWQYTSKGTVPGILNGTGSVDLDRFHYTDLGPYRIP